MCYNNNNNSLGVVVHGCIDGFSQGIMFLKCSNDLSQTVLELFLNAVEKDVDSC